MRKKMIRYIDDDVVPSSLLYKQPLQSVLLVFCLILRVRASMHAKCLHENGESLIFMVCELDSSIRS